MLNISVVIPAYNSTAFIKRAINSVLCQSYPVYEIIIVDDGSVDGLESYLSQNFSTLVYVKQNNQGASAARNKGVSLARGQWIAFLDADDSWKASKLQRQVEAIQATEDAPDLCYCNYGYAGEDSTSIKRYKTKRVELCDVLKYPYLGTPTVLVRKTAFEKINGFDETLTTAEDIDMYLKLAVLKPFLLVEEALVNIYRTEGSLANRYNTWSNERFVYQRLLNNRNYSEYSLIIKEHIHKISYDELLYLIQHRKYGEFKERWTTQAVNLKIKEKLKLVSIYCFKKLIPQPTIRLIKKIIK